MISIIIVNWNQKFLTEQCLISLKNINNINFNIILVDNGSNDDSVLFFKEKYPYLTIISNRENLGFTGGNNVGITQAINFGSKYVYLLNNDTEVDVNFLLESINVAISDKKIGIVGSSVFYYNPSNIMWFSGGQADWITGNMIDNRVGKIIDVNTELIEDVDEVAGAGMLIKTEVLKDIGLLDDRFFIYFEETDLCARAKKNKWRVVWSPKSVVWHKVSSTFGESSPIMIYLMTRNRWLFMKKNSPNFLIFSFYYIIKISRDILINLFKNNILLSKALYYGIKDALYNNFGKGNINLFQNKN